MTCRNGNKAPGRRARQQDPDEVSQWLEETHPAIERRAKEEHAEIHWGDEVDRWVAAHSDRLEIFYLTRYAPERNPDEYLNNHLKS